MDTTLTLTLNETERAALTDALDAYLPALEQEASRIDRTRDAHPVWDRVRRLEELRGRLKALGRERRQG